jgi:hypothetical protein
MGDLSAHERVTVAMLTGIAEHHAYLRRIDRAEAEAAIRECLADRSVPAARWPVLLDEAAAGYTPANPEQRPGYPAALDLLTACGANPAWAEQVWRDRHRKGSGAWRV